MPVGSFDYFWASQALTAAALGACFEAAMSKGEISMREAWNRTYGVTVTGILVITNFFVPLLLWPHDPLLICITGGLSSVRRMARSYAPGYVPESQHLLPVAYRASKAALNMMMLAWHWILEQDRVQV